MTNPLRNFSDEALREELARRQRKRGERDERDPFKPCDECAHFIPWSADYDAPEDYNPCGKGHAMTFRVPEYVLDYDWGYYRRVCRDRAPRPTPPQSSAHDATHSEKL